MKPDFLSFPETAKYLNVSLSTLENMIRGFYTSSKGVVVNKDYKNFPQPIRIGGKRRFKKAAIDRWILAQS